MPEGRCPKCHEMGYRNVLFNYSSFHCDHCGYKESPRQDFPYSQEDFEADQETLRAAGWGDESD